MLVPGECILTGRENNAIGTVETQRKAKNEDAAFRCALANLSRMPQRRNSYSFLCRSLRFHTVLVALSLPAGVADERCCDSVATGWITANAIENVHSTRAENTSLTRIAISQRGWFFIDILSCLPVSYVCRHCLVCSTAFAAKALPFALCVSTAFAAETLPLPCGSQVRHARRQQRVRRYDTVPFLDLPLRFLCLSLTFRCIFSAFPCAEAAAAEAPGW